MRGTCSPAARHSRWLAVGEPGTLTGFLRDFLHHLDLELSLGKQLLQPRILGRAASAAGRRLRHLATADSNSRSASRRIATYLLFRETRFAHYPLRIASQCLT